MSKSYWEWESVFRLVPQKCALLVVDMQNGFLEKNSPLEVPMAREQVPALQRLISFCRRKQIPVLYSAFYVAEDSRFDFYWRIAKQRGLKLERPDCQFRKGNHETKIFKELKPLPNERVIFKSGYDCFAGTELDHLLHSMQVNTLLVAGTVLNWCVDSTVRSAYHRYYNVAAIADCVSTYAHGGGTAEQWYKMELNLIAEAFGRVVTSQEAMDELSSVSAGISEKGGLG